MSINVVIGTYSQCSGVTDTFLIPETVRYTEVLQNSYNYKNRGLLKIE